MRNQRWMLALIGLLAVGLLAAGCGDDDSSSTEGSTPTEMSDATTEDSDGDSEDAGEGASADDVYNACIDAVEGTAVEDQAKPQCEQARDAFEECTTQAGKAGNDQATELALQICQQAADQAVKALESAGG